MNDRFDELKEKDEESQKQQSGEDEVTSPQSTDDAASVDDRSVDDQAGIDTPAFEYDDVDQDSLYARPDAWAAFGLALDEARIELRREHGVTEEVPKRELHDAALQVLNDAGEDIAEQVAQQRREN